jgi:hypothetical protein
MTDDINTKPKRKFEVVDGIETPLHERWRYRVPETYRKHLEALEAHQDQIVAMRKALLAIHNDISAAVEKSDHRRSFHVEALGVLQAIEEARVLLECAGDKLVHALPTEAYMDRQTLEAMETGKWRNW